MQDNTLVRVTEILPEKIIIIPLFIRPIFPGMMVPLVLSGESMIETIEGIMNSEQKIGGTVLVEKSNDEVITSDSLYKVGTSIKILKIAQIDNESVQVMVNAIGRFSYRETVKDTSPLQWRVEHHKDIFTLTHDETKAYTLAIISSMRDLIKFNSLFQEEFKLFLNKFTAEDPSRLADFIASVTSADSHEIQEVLETFDLKKRIEKVMVLLKKEIKLNELQRKISGKIEERLSKQQKEFFLREQLKEIKKELGLEKDEKTSEIEKIEDRISKLVLTEEAEKVISSELKKIKYLEPHS